ncbi:MAG TPA: DUF1549 and DUF1553 domain-containing protein [Gemmataceae bacterium]|nr:DUF1549 and DUF1553 domain-containing protein [Gemmataceae bacterium]
MTRWLSAALLALFAVAAHGNGGEIDFDKARDFWSFQPIKKPTVPAVQNSAWAQTPVDYFILAKLQAKGLSPSPAAEPRILLRRLYFDLIGLPPTPEEMERFLREYPAKPQAAIEKVIDQLLASPHYGERWGRHWLDVVRFGQTNGYERDGEKPNAWRYRDYVIDSFNRDKPFDQFVKEQIAGDELTPVTDDGIIATGFFRLGVWDDEPDDKQQAEFDDLDDMLATTGEAFLGLTIGCARCHEHKFDPIRHEDYYSLLAFYRNIRQGKLIQTIDPTIQTPLKGGGTALAIQEDIAKPKSTNVLNRGQASMPGAEVRPGFLPVLCRSNETAVPKSIKPIGDKSLGRRKVLAEWIAGKHNPLTARVIVNRLWQHHFGKGLVVTPNDFGRNGSAPSHPELLDWLALELIEQGWSLKYVHKLILLSSVYQQSSSNSSPQASEASLRDADNSLLWRQNLRRLEAEAIRDSVLAVNGRLNSKMFGRGIFPTLPQEVLNTQSRPGNGWENSTAPVEQSRRSVYIFVKRTLGVPLLETFDFANPDKSIAARANTTIAPQALILLNSQFMDDQANAFAERLKRECGEDPAKQIERAFRLALGRTPTTKESEIAKAYLQRSQSLPALCKMILNLNEFVYVD